MEVQAMKARERLLISFVSVIAFTVTAIAGPVPWPPGRVDINKARIFRVLLCPKFFASSDDF